MRISSRTDERTHLIDFVEQETRGRGHQVTLVGPPVGVDMLRTSGVNLRCLTLRTLSKAAANQMPNAWLTARTEPGEAETLARLTDMNENQRANEVSASAKGEKGNA